jgi:hypothetical protein
MDFFSVHFSVTQCIKFPFQLSGYMVESIVSTPFSTFTPSGVSTFPPA